MKMRELHIVIGRSGVYSDKQWWPVRAFAAKERAEVFANLCTIKAAEAYGLYQRALDIPDDWREKEEFRFAEDPQGRIESDTEYSVETIPFDSKRES